MCLEPANESCLAVPFGAQLPTGIPQDTTDMSDLVGLENLVANTAYLKAQQINCNETRKRHSLALPKPRKSFGLLTAVEKKYETLCEQQPIGRKLFQQFVLSSNPQYVAAAELLEVLSTWSTAEDGTRAKCKQSILAKFCQPEFRSLLLYLTEESAETCKYLTDKNFNEPMMRKIREATRDFLKGKPFAEYLKSPFFYRFLQWKEYEGQKISDRYFYEFRTLGKGGFGEVSVKYASIFLQVLIPDCYLGNTLKNLKLL